MKMLRIVALVLLLASPLLAANAPEPDGKPHKFTLHDRQFWIDEKPMRVMAGEIHPGRVMPEF
jgi:beta-galactosidase